MRDTAINLRARGAQRDLIDRAARMLGKNRSDFMLEASCEKAQGVMLDQVYFALEGNDFKRFAQLLDAPIKPNAALEKLLATPAPWEKSNTASARPATKAPKASKQKRT